MKTKLFLLALIVGLSSHSNGQSSFKEKLEPNVFWKKYALVIQQEGSWNFHFVLKDGYIDTAKVFYKDEYRFGYKILYNTHQKIQYEIEVFNINEDFVNDTIEKYDANGRHINDEYTTYEYDENNLPVKLQFYYKVGTSKHLSGIQKFIYNKNGTIKIRINTDFLSDEKLQVSTARFKYNKCNSISQVRNSSDPEEEYPIIGICTPNIYKLERFEYKYNDDCIWTEKYSVVDGNKKLIAKRVLKSQSETQ